MNARVVNWTGDVPDRLSREERKAMLRAYKERERAAADTRLPLARSELVALFDHLDARVSEDGCDHSFRHSERFLRERGHDVAPVVAWLEESGGYCDCESLMNVADEWDES